MNKKIFKFSFLFMSLFIGLSAISQDKIIKTANSDFKNLQYQSAIKRYTKAWNKMKKNTTKKNRVAFKLAECYRLTNKPSDAIFWYSKVADKKRAWKNPGIFLHYADALRRVGNCKQAIVYYKKHLEKYSDDFLAKIGILSCRNFTEASKKSRFIIYNEKDLNSTEDDYSTAFSSKKYNQLFFSSNRKGATGKYRENWTGAWYSDIYQSNNKNSVWQPPVLSDKKGVLNTEANEGTPTFNKKFTSVYFTRCNKGVDNKVYCNIMQSNRIGHRWTKPKTILSDASSNTGQPWISKDELVIYFVSDRKGGFGGKDIWMATRQRKGKIFDEPINLGPIINTPGNEMFPYFWADSILYFSSNGHPGYGGLDIFKSTLHDTIWEVPQNILSPLNSIDDDFAIIFKDEKEGYLSSNRQGGLGGDDIYHFIKKKIFFNLEGIVKNERTLFTFPDVNVSLISSKETEIKLTDEQGHYSFDSTFFNEDNQYNLIFSKDNFFSVSYEINTYDYYDNHDFIYNVLLKPIPEEPILLPEILYDLGKWNLKPQYQDSLMVLVKILTDNPNLIIELRSHTDSRASIEFNNELSQKRAQSVVDFLILKGIDPGQLIAKGYGEGVPRTLTRDFPEKGEAFKKDVVLTDLFINNLAANKLKESAHELNRRTEFMIIAKDYKPSSVVVNNITEIEIINDSLGMAINYNLSPENYRLIDCYINNYKSEAILDQENAGSFIGEQKVIELMKQGALSKENFEGNVDEILQNNKVKEGAIVIIDKLRLGDRSVSNIQLTVRNSTGLLISLDNNILNKFGSYKIDDIKKQIIFK